METGLLSHHLLTPTSCHIYCTEITPHSCLKSSHPDTRANKHLFQSPQSIKTNTYISPPPPMSYIWKVHPLEFSLLYRESKLVHLVLPPVVLTVATCTRSSCPGCTSSSTAISSPVVGKCWPWPRKPYLLDADSAQWRPICLSAADC